MTLAAKLRAPPSRPAAPRGDSLLLGNPFPILEEAVRAKKTARGEPRKSAARMTPAVPLRVCAIFGTDQFENAAAQRTRVVEL
jgi:hypothetical protein